MNKLVDIRSARFGFLMRPGSIWVGMHYSPENKRFCINLLPCCTIWFIRQGGNAPK